MPKIIVTSRYIKPNAHKRVGNYIKYIATREGVEKPVPKPKVSQELDCEIFMNYLDSRPNSHGLFSETDKPIVLDKVAKEVANHEGAIWTHIVSLKREDAERMGYTDLEHWRDLVRRHISDIAVAQKITPENIRWYAAFHNKETNPHIHIVVYSENTHEGYLTKNGIEKIRSAFANDIYKDELQNLYQQQTTVRNKLRPEAKNVMKNLLSELQNNNQFDPQLEQLVLKLQSQLRNFKGKKVYGYLQPNVKKTVDQIVAELAKNPVLTKMYDEWCALEQQKYEIYTSAVQKFPPLEENKVFKPIKNAVINAVLEMDFSTEMFMEYDDGVFDETESDGDLYIKWTAEYKSACSELYKNHDISKAFELFQAEAEKGNILAAFDIGKMYRNGLLGEDNVPKADEYFQKALQSFRTLEPTAKRLKLYVQYRIGKIYALGLGTEQDYSKAFEWFEKSAAAGNKFAQYSLGSLYFFGNGVPQNYEKAFEYYKLSADQDNAYACSSDTTSQSGTESSTGSSQTSTSSSQSTLISASTDQPNTEQSSDDSPQTSENSAPAEKKSRILIAYFTRVGNTDFPDDIDAVASASLNRQNSILVGNTELVANMIKEETGGELFRIETEKKYPADYNELVDYGRAEPNEDSRPVLTTHVENIDDYDIVFLGYPNWWYDMPMAVYSFLEEYDFSGKTVIPFCTHGGSRFSSTVSTLREKLSASTVMDGFEIYGENASNAGNGVSEWLNNLNGTINILQNE